jgi:hypothetical protein
VSTIYSHLADLIAQGQLAVEAVVPAERLAQVRAAIQAAGSAERLAPIHARLGGAADYSLIRCVANAWKREAEDPGGSSRNSGPIQRGAA